VADEVKRYLDVALAEPAVRGLITWGLSDRHSWLTVTDEHLARYAGAWNKGESPGFNLGFQFDASMKRKTMYQAFASAFKSGL
jgi:endo-1,4-beta-xylanase